MSIRFIPFSALLLALACTAPGDAVPAKKTAAPFKPLLSLRPVAISLAKGATQAFQAEINYPEGVSYIRQPVAWSVAEPGGGAINGAGLYMAPAVPGTYHVQVKREDFPEVTATATVTVK